MNYTTQHAINVQVWPKYRVVCGELTRLKSPNHCPERFARGRWVCENLALQ